MTLDIERLHTATASCLSDLQLDRLTLGELNAVEQTSAEAHIETCARCAERSSFLKASAANCEIRQGATVRALAREPRSRPWLAWPWVGLASLSAAAVAALLLVAVLPAHEGDEVRIKGGDVSLEAYVSQPNGVAALVLPNDALHPGDHMSFAVTTPRDGYLGLLGADSQARVFVYYPQGEMLEKQTSVSNQFLPMSVTLDDTLGTERIFAVFCDDALPVSRLVKETEDALGRAQGRPEALTRLVIPCAQSSILIRKTLRQP